MSEIKDFAMTVCGAAVLCAAANMLAPAEKYEKVIKITLAAVMICAIITPLTRLSQIRLEFERYRAADAGYHDGLRDEIESQTESLMERAAAGLIEEALRKNGVRPKNILINTDRTQDGGISIGQVSVTVGAAAEAAVAEKVIKDELGIDSVVIRW